MLHENILQNFTEDSINSLFTNIHNHINYFLLATNIL